MVDNWTLRERPLMLERRIEFENYGLVRDFLNRSADLSEKEGVYPDMNFSRTHVSMTLLPNEGCTEFDEAQLRFANEVNRFAPSNNITAPLVTEYAVEMS